MSAPDSLRIGGARRRRELLFGTVGLLATSGVGLALLTLLVDVALDALPALSTAFLIGAPSLDASRAGIGPALAGSAWLLVATALLAVPLATGAAVWLVEYAPDGWGTRLIERNIQHLAGVPSVVYGVVGLTLFVRAAALERSLLAGALTLALFVLPILILSAQEALRAVPDELREAALALGASRWQVVRRQVLPTALPDLLSGALLALARVLGETAPLVLVGTLGYVAFVPTAPTDALTALPLLIFDWARRPQPEFQALAAAAVVVLLLSIVTLHLLAAIARQVARRRARWR